MFGLIVLMAIGIYLLAFYLVVKATLRWARNSGRSTKRWGWIAALAMYLPVFWDHIPTVLLHQYLCATEQGFWVYKTVEEWQQENPGVADTLRWTNVPNNFEAQGVTRGYRLNQRFAWEIVETQPLPLLPVWITQHSIVDRRNKEVTAKHVGVGSGYGNLALGGKGAWKFWLNMPPCQDTRNLFTDYRRRAERQGEIE